MLTPGGLLVRSGKSILSFHDDNTPSQTVSHESEDAGQDSFKPVSGWTLVSVIIGLTTTCLLVLLDISILVTAVPTITNDFHSLFDIGWYGGAYNLASAALQPLSGKIYTYLSAKWTFLSFLLLFEVGNLICGLAVSSPMFIMGRAVAGMGASGLQNGAFTVIAACVRLEKRPFWTGILLGVGQLGLVAGPLIGGAITEYSTWRWCFYINLPVGVVAALTVALARIPDVRAQQHKPVARLSVWNLDLPGFFIFAPFAIMVLLALQYGGNNYPWNSATVIGLFCGGASALIIFMAWEYHVGTQAMIPLSIIRKRQVWTSCLAMLFLFGTVIATSYYMAVFFQAVKGMTPLRSGLSTLPLILSQLFGTVLSAVYVQRLGHYLPAMITGAIIAIVGNGLLSTLGPESSTIQWAGYQIIVGLGRGITFQMPLLAVQAHTPSEVVPLATAALVFCQTFGGAVFISASNSVFSNKLRDDLTAHIPLLRADDIGTDEIINAGAINLEKFVPPQLLPTVLAAYANGISAVFHLAVAASGCLIFVSWGMGFQDIRREAAR